jgi:hypothetical protein
MGAISLPIGLNLMDWEQLIGMYRNLLEGSGFCYSFGLIKMTSIVTGTAFSAFRLVCFFDFDLFLKSHLFHDFSPYPAVRKGGGI